MRSILFPVPSIHEQKRIVSRIEEIQPIVKKYQRTEDALKRLNTEIFDKLKKSILQEAIQGKLVSQITEEGTAQELLKQIKTEKEKLVKKGKLKKSALTDSVIYKGDDNKYYERINGQIVEVELPFEYPNSWAVLRLKDICQLIDGEKRNGKGICLDAKYLRGKSSATIVEKGKFVYAGDNIILVDGVLYRYNGVFYSLFPDNDIQKMLLEKYRTEMGKSNTASMLRTQPTCSGSV